MKIYTTVHLSLTPVYTRNQSANPILHLCSGKIC